MRVAFAAVALLALSVATGCQRAVPAGPPELHLGVDTCDGCGMAIEDARYAAAAITAIAAERHAVKFDDLGCLARWEAGAPGSGVRKRWVHDRPTGEWIDAGSATFVVVSDLVTPMGSGVAAFRNRPDAEAIVAERGGEVSTWSAVIARSRDGSLAARPRPGQEEPR